MKEPRTLEEYRDFCKVLKLKIKKQKMIIEDMEDTQNKLQQELNTYKNNPGGDRPENDLYFPNQYAMTPMNLPFPRPPIDTVNLKGKNEIMQILKANVERLGITPQSIYRIADVHGRNQVESDHFRTVLSKINLGLTPKQISTLIYVFDENCNSFISKQEYNEALQGYQIAQQETENSHIYKHICLEKLASLVNEDRIKANSFYDQMNPKNLPTVDLNMFEVHIKKYFEGRIQEKEIVGAFYGMDLESNGLVDKQNFVYGVNSAIRKVATMGPTKKPQENTNLPAQSRMLNSDMTNTGMNNYVEKMVEKHSQSPRKPNQIAQSRASFSMEKAIESVVNAKIPLESLSAEEVLNKLKQEYGVELPMFYEELCRVPMGQRTTLFNFKKTVRKLQKGKRVELSLVSSLFKLIDFRQKGSIHFTQLLYFYLANSSDVSMILRLLGKYFYNNDLNCERFWFLFGINPDADISKNRFIEVMCKTFEGPDELGRLWENMWNYFDKGRGVLPVAALSNEISKYEIVDLTPK